MQVEKRLSWGYTATGSYTYQVAKNDDGDSYTFLYDRPLGRGNTDDITRHAFNIAQNFDNAHLAKAANGARIGTRLPISPSEDGASMP